MKRLQMIFCIAMTALISGCSTATSVKTYTVTFDSNGGSDEKTKLLCRFC